MTLGLGPVDGVRPSLGIESNGFGGKVKACGGKIKEIVNRIFSPDNVRIYGGFIAGAGVGAIVVVAATLSPEMAIIAGIACLIAGIALLLRNSNRNPQQDAPEAPPLSPTPSSSRSPSPSGAPAAVAQENNAPLEGPPGPPDCLPPPPPPSAPGLNPSALGASAPPRPPAVGGMGDLAAQLKAQRLKKTTIPAKNEGEDNEGAEGRTPNGAGNQLNLVEQVRAHHAERKIRQAQNRGIDPANKAKPAAGAAAQKDFRAEAFNKGK